LTSFRLSFNLVTSIREIWPFLNPMTAYFGLIGWTSIEVIALSMKSLPSSLWVPTSN
jgi:hypothetical protein